MQGIILKRYVPDDEPVWNAFVAGAKNALFLFYRNYTEYHAARFCDHSLIAYAGNSPIALLPANMDNNTFYSHQGLSFGGWITNVSMKTATMLLLFEHLMDYLQKASITSLVYKRIPHIYHDIPANEDEYALFKHNAQLMECNVAAVIDYRHLITFSSRRKRGISKAAKAEIVIVESRDYSTYYPILENLLENKFNSRPTHSLIELIKLSSQFPENIRLFTAYKNFVMLAGVIIYESAHVAHVQYVASGEEGRKCGALDLIFDHLIHNVFSHKRYFDFGTSNEQNGCILNQGLIDQKEEFGARAVTHNVYKIIVTP